MSLATGVMDFRGVGNFAKAYGKTVGKNRGSLNLGKEFERRGDLKPPIDTELFKKLLYGGLIAGGTAGAYYATK